MATFLGLRARLGMRSVGVTDSGRSGLTACISAARDPGEWSHQNGTVINVIPISTYQRSTNFTHLLKVLAFCHHFAASAGMSRTQVRNSNALPHGIQTQYYTEAKIS